MKLIKPTYSLVIDDYILGIKDDHPMSKKILALVSATKTMRTSFSLMTGDCGFKKGLCKTNRDGNPKNCCRDCFANNGYMFRGDLILRSDLEKYNHKFRKDIGFWRAGKGCSLPRGLRSFICSFHTCGPFKGSLDDWINLHISLYDLNKMAMSLYKDFLKDVGKFKRGRWTI